MSPRPQQIEHIVDQRRRVADMQHQRLAGELRRLARELHGVQAETPGVGRGGQHLDADQPVVAFEGRHRARQVAEVWPGRMAAADVRHAGATDVEEGIGGAWLASRGRSAEKRRWWPHRRNRRRPRRRHPVRRRCDPPAGGWFRTAGGWKTWVWRSMKPGATKAPRASTILWAGASSVSTITPCATWTSRSRISPESTSTTLPWVMLSVLKWTPLAGSRLVQRPQGVANRAPARMQGTIGGDGFRIRLHATR